MNYFSNIKKSFKFKNYINYIVLAAFILLITVLNGEKMINRSTMNLLPIVAYSIILAISLNLVVGFLGELSLGHAGFMCIGAYIGSLASLLINYKIQNPTVSLIISMFIGGLAAALFGFIIGLPALRLKGDYLAIVTLAFGEIVRTVIKNLDVFGKADGLKTSNFIYTFGKTEVKSTIKIPAADLYLIAFITVFIVLILIQNLIRSKHGRAITAIRDNEIAAKAMGINITFYKLFVFTISSFFAGVAGVIYGHCTTPIRYNTFSYNYSIEILVMVVIGGLGSINGSIIAATLITYINSLLQNNFSGDLASIKLLVYAFILIVIILFNNAPMFNPIKEKLNIKAAINKRRKIKPENIKDDPAAWNRIQTKISMDELLSTDVQQRNNGSLSKPDRREK